MIDTKKRKKIPKYLMQIFLIIALSFGIFKLHSLICIQDEQWAAYENATTEYKYQYSDKKYRLIIDGIKGCRYRIYTLNGEKVKDIILKNEKTELWLPEGVYTFVYPNGDRIHVPVDGIRTTVKDFE